MENPSEPITIDQALHWYVSEFLVGKKRDRTIAEYQKDLRKIFSAIPLKHVTDLALSHLNHYVASHTPPLSPSTLRCRLSALSSLLSALRSRDLIPYNVMERFERPELVDRLPDYLTTAQVHDSILFAPASHASLRWLHFTAVIHVVWVDPLGFINTLKTYLHNSVVTQGQPPLSNYY